MDPTADPGSVLPALHLSMGQQFELERLSRAIDATSDVPTLRAMAKKLLQAFHCQRAATQWVMREKAGPQLDHAALALETLPQGEPVPPWDDPLM